jgi:transcriptional regulator SbtR-like protein
VLFVDYIAAKQLIAPALNALVGDPKKVFEASYTRIQEALRALVKRAIKSGDIRKDLDPIDLLRALIGVANVATSPDWQQSARRLVDILIIGSLPTKEAEALGLGVTGNRGVRSAAEQIEVETSSCA